MRNSLRDARANLWLRIGTNLAKVPMSAILILAATACATTVALFGLLISVIVA